MSNITIDFQFTATKLWELWFQNFEHDYGVQLSSFCLRGARVPDFDPEKVCKWVLS